MHSGKALIVDDDSRVVQFKLKRMLEARGMGVDIAGSGQAALEFLKNHAPDVIFMDRVMPDIDGYEVTRIIKANPQTAEIPVIMCTGNDTPEDRERAQLVGASGFVVKPFDDSALDCLLADLSKGRASTAPVVAPATSAPVARVSPPVMVVASAAVDRPVPIPALGLTGPAIAGDSAGVAERIAQQVAEKLLREAMASLSAESERVSRGVAQEAATRATRDALVSWRSEVAQIHENVRLDAIAAATQAARESVQLAVDAAQAARRTEAMAAEATLREALASVHATAERVERATLGSVKAALEDAARNFLESARADLNEGARIEAQTVAKPVAETVARAVAEQLVRVMLGAAHQDEAAFRADLQRAALASAEQATREMLQRAGDAADAARRSTDVTNQARLQEALSAAHTSAERLARETLDSAKLALEEASREILDAARADLQDRAQVAAEAAAKPAAEIAARAVTEQLAQVALAALNEDAARLRTDVGQASVTAAQQVAREVVQQAADAAESARQAAALTAEDKLQLALASVPALAERVARESLDLARAAMEDASREALASLRAELHDSVRLAAEAAARPVAEEVTRTAFVAAHAEEVAWRNRIEEAALGVAQRVGRDIVKPAFEAAAQPALHAAPGDQSLGQAAATTRTEASSATPPVQAVPESRPPGGPSPKVLLPWLAGVTLAVLYLVFKSF